MIGRFSPYVSTMKTLLVAVVVGALFAAAATVIYTTFIKEGALALLVLAWIATTASALVAVRVASPASSDARPREPSRSRARSPAPVIPDDAVRETGTVKWFNRSKGFGFIIRDNGGEIFVHYRSIRARPGERRPGLRDGQTVSFVAVEGGKGWQAEDVTGD